MSVQITIESKFTLELNEQEIGALDAIFGYSPEAFLKAFRKEMGTEYVRPYEDGVRSLHQRVRKCTGPALADIRAVRTRLRTALQNGQA